MRFIKLVYIVPHRLLSWPHSHYRVNLTKHQEHGQISPQIKKKINYDFMIFDFCIAKIFS